jgi:nucleotide-binding universal stress UspA family protein/mono/diheme cytochrome c family protein
MTRDIKRILVAVDFSAASAAAIDYAQMLAQRFSAGIHLLHVCEAPWNQEPGRDAECDLTAIAAGIHHLEASTEILFDNPVHGIVTAAAAGAADLIVMGTHGHAPGGHLLMGSVAERVVRMAPCPVLTVRQSGTPEWHKPQSRVAALVAALAMAVLLSPWLARGAFAQEVAAAPGPVVTDNSTELRQRIAGRETFRTYCASCHGTSARGDGQLAASLRRKPADLTEIAKRNGGLFPSDVVFRTIDGRQPVRGHGGPDMPAWGDTFLKSRDGGDAKTVRETIGSLVEYLQSLQSTPNH